MSNVPDLKLPKFEERKIATNKNTYTYSVKVGNLWYKFFQAKKTKK